MKKTVITLLSGFMVICGYAQTEYDALLFSENNYEGTARTVAMGNAFTALGGDLGSIGINPAGSAVAGYSQITLTPSITFTANTTKGVSPYSDGSLPYFQESIKSRTTKFNMPNMGVTLNFDTHRTSGLKNLTFGFLYNQTAYWDDDLYARGVNGNTSFMGSMAFDATRAGMTWQDLYNDPKSSYDPYQYMPWKTVVGYNSGMISTYGAGDGDFVGASEVIAEDSNGNLLIFQGGDLDQTYGRRVSGGKYDYLFNIGANWSDFIYFGANIGFTSIDYSYDEYFKEVAVDPSNFGIEIDEKQVIHFKDMLYKYSYTATGTGFYGKFGVIVTPGGGFRIGAAVQTPTLNRISEEWYHDGSTTYLEKEYNDYEESPLGEGEYIMLSPFRANFGLAYTLGQFGVISADYEFCDYGQMRYKASDYGRDYFEDINAAIRDKFTVSHMLRIGAEIKPVPSLAVRAGYDLTTSPEKYIYDYKDVSSIKMQNIGFGLGYSSKKSFYADFAVRKTIPADEYFMPYNDYIFATDENGDFILDGNGNYIVDEDGFAPEIRNRKSLWKVMLTLGWRF